MLGRSYVPDVAALGALKELGIGCGNLRSSLRSHQERGERDLDRVGSDPG